MFTNRALTLTATALIYSTIVLAQENSGLTQAQRVVLDTPEVIDLQLTPIIRRRSAGVYEKVSGPFKPGSKIAFELVATNSSMIALDLFAWDTFSQNRLRLFRGGQEVPYRKGLDDLLKSKDKEPVMEYTHLVVAHLEPHQPKSIETIDLGVWYDSLEPGHYELSTRHRFVSAGKWVDSASVTFEVEAK